MPPQPDDPHSGALFCPCCKTRCVPLRCPTCKAISTLACPGCTWHLDFPNLFDETVKRLPRDVMTDVLRGIAAARLEKETPS